MLSINAIEKKASILLNEYNGGEAPIRIKKIIKNMGLRIIKHDLGENVSGLLYIENGIGIIGYNESESEVRKRFTFAHELGHYVLHRLKKELFVDHKKFKAVFRDEKSTTGELIQEREANAFAAAILMPRKLVIKEIERFSFDLGCDEEDIFGELAKKFKVSSQAMTYRISNLNLF